MKRFLALFLTAVMVCSLAACGGKTEEKPEVLGKAEEIAVTPLTLYQIEKQESEWELCDAEWQNLQLSEADAAKYPALAAALEDMNMEQDVYHADWAVQAKEDAQTAKDEMGEYYYPFYNTSEYYVQRADDRILSIREDFGEYYGGVHGMYGTIGHVFDTATGERLTLSDVISDTDVLPAILADKLEEKYPDDIHDFNDSVTETLAGYALEDFKWTLDYQGITFYFDPYELASFAAGRLTAVIWFDEHPELFVEKHTEQPESGYIRAIPLGDNIEVDLNGEDGERDNLYVQGAPIGEYGEQRLNIYRNEDLYSDPDSFGYEFMPYLVCQNDEFYILAESMADNGYTTMTVYNLQGEISVSHVLEGTGVHYPPMEWDDNQCDGREVLNDPSCMRLDTMVYMLGSMTGTDTYSMEGGSLDRDNIYYTLPETLPALVSKVPLEVYVVEADDLEEIPAGTQFHFLRTDNESYVDMRMDDGRECRIEVEYNGWDRTVNGISEFDAFDGILYAG